MYNVSQNDFINCVLEIETSLKTSREDALRKLKDKQDLYEDGENIIKLGNHKFGVNRQELDLSIVFKDDKLFYHLSGTDFYQELKNEILNNSRKYWNQEFISENDSVYRSSFLAFKIYKDQNPEIFYKSTKDLIYKLEYFLCNKDIFKCNKYQKIAANYDWSIMATKYDDLFENLK